LSKEEKAYYDAFQDEELEILEKIGSNYRRTRIE